MGREPSQIEGFPPASGSPNSRLARRSEQTAIALDSLERTQTPGADGRRASYVHAFRLLLQRRTDAIR